MKYGITYIDNFTGVQNTETGSARFLDSLKADELNGEIKILTIYSSSDDWETSSKIYSCES